MRVIQSFLPFVIFFSVACLAAPTRRFQNCERLELEPRHGEEFNGRVHCTPVLSSREDHDELDARAEPGMQHKNEHANLPTTSFHPVPEHWNYNTGEHSFTGKEVNEAAAHMIKSINKAEPWNRAWDKRPVMETYPKPGTGFPNTQKDNPAPNHKDIVSYHHPLRKAGTEGPGGARVVGYRKTDSSALTIGVSVHDKNKPIPIAKDGRLQAKSHPFSMVTPTSPSNKYRNKLKTHGLAVVALNRMSRGKRTSHKRR